MAEINGDNIANSAGTGAPNLPYGNKVAGVAAAGRFTPTSPTSNTNVATVTFSSCMYSRVNNIVTVSGAAQVGASAASSVILTMSLPIASTFVSTDDANGLTNHFNNTDTSGGINAVAASSHVIMQYVAIGTGATAQNFVYQYEVLP